jgi:hypothetical protein
MQEGTAAVAGKKASFTQQDVRYSPAGLKRYPTHGSVVM